MSQKARRVLLTLLFGATQLLVVVLVFVGWYYLGHTNIALHLADYSSKVLTLAHYLFAGFFFSFLILLCLAIIGITGFLLYLWGKFTQKQATKWNRKINHKISDWRDRRETKERLRASQEPEWEV